MGSHKLISMRILDLHIKTWMETLPVNPVILHTSIYTWKRWKGLHINMKCMRINAMETDLYLKDEVEVMWPKRHPAHLFSTSDHPICSDYFLQHKRPECFISLCNWCQLINDEAHHLTLCSPTRVCQQCSRLNSTVNTNSQYFTSAGALALHMWLSMKEHICM